MTKNVTLLLLFFISLLSYTQESMVFKPGFKPEKKYTMQLKTASYSEIDFIADEEILDKIKSRGVELPMIIEEETHISTQNTTRSLDEEGEFPATLEYGKAISTITRNGETVTEEQPYSGMKILGKYNKENKFIVDTIIGEKITGSIRESLKTTLQSLQEQIQFPQKPVKIGETFESEFPITIPMEGMNPIHINIHIEYTLQEIRGNKAFLSLKQSVTLDTDQEETNITAGGNGNGSAEYDIEEHFLTGYTSELPINLTMKFNEKLTVKGKMKSKTEQKVTIE